MNIIVNEKKIILPLSTHYIVLDVVCEFCTIEVSNGCYYGCILVNNKTDTPIRFRDNVRNLFQLEAKKSSFLNRNLTLGWGIISILDGS